MTATLICLAPQVQKLRFREQSYLSKTNSQPEMEPALLTVKFHAICLAAQKTKSALFGLVYLTGLVA